MRVYELESFRNPPTSYIEIKPNDFLDLLADTEACPSILCPTEIDKLGGDGFVLGSFEEYPPGREIDCLEDSSAVDVLVFDVDHMTQAEVDEALDEIKKYNSAVYSTWANTAEEPRLRVAVQLATPLPNKKEHPYKSTYEAIAKKLKIKYDKNACDRVRFFFGPQHKDTGALIRKRFEGPPIPLPPVSAVPLDYDDAYEVTSDKPKKAELKLRAKQLRTRNPKLATAFDAILRGASFAPKGSRHATTLRVSLELVKWWPNLDAGWFAKEYLSAVWEAMWPEGPSIALRDWNDAVSGAKRKIAEWKQKVPPKNLILCHGNSYYVYHPDAETYEGPFLANALPIAVRDFLGSVPDVQEFRITKQGQTLKSATELCHEYGTTAKDVIWHAKKPDGVLFCEKTRILNLQAYEWIDWTPVNHDVAAQLLGAMAGPKINDLLSYFSKFRDLSLCLPALTFVGGPGVWKSRIMEILSRFWTDKSVSHTNRARHAMGRFNTVLLKNPTCWSEEILYRTSQGKAVPELYRDQITSRVQFVEPKGLPVVPINSAMRHLISVNNDAQLFSHELDTDSVAATMERFLVINVDEAAVRKFETCWQGTDAMEGLREGSMLLEHIRWIEENHESNSEGRLYVSPKTDRHVLLRSRFQDDLLNYLWQIAITAVSREKRFGTLSIDRMPLMIDGQGVLRLSPKRLQLLWTASDLIKGTKISAPTAQKIGNLLTKAGFKRRKNERATRSPTGGWEVDIATLKDFIEISEIISWESFIEDCKSVFKREFIVQN